MQRAVKLIKALLGLYVGISFIFIGNGLAITSAGVILKGGGYSELAIGLVTSCFFLGAMCSTIFTYSFISAFGYVRSYAILTALFALSALFHNFWSNIFYWAILRFFLGFSYYSIVMIVESLLNTKSTNKNRSVFLGLYEIIYYASFGIGVLFLSLKLDSSYIILISASFIVLGSIPVNIIGIREPRLPPKRKLFIPNIFGVVPLALFSTFVGGIALNGFFSMGSVYVLNLGQDVSMISLFMIVAMVGGFVSQIFFGLYSYKIGRKYSIMLAASTGLVASTLMVLFSDNFLAQILLVFFIGFGTFCLYVLGLARANDVLHDKSKTVEIGAALLLSYTTGSLFGPLIAGLFMKMFGSKGFMLVYVVALFALIIFALYQRQVPKEDRSDEFPTSKLTESL